MQTIAHEHVILVEMLCTYSLLQNYMTIFANVVILVTTLCVVLTYGIVFSNVVFQRCLLNA